MVQKIRAVKLPGFCPHSAEVAKRTKASTGFVHLSKPQKIHQFGVFSLDNTPNWCIIINVIKRGTAQEDKKMKNTMWYAVMRDNDDTDWGTGSNNMDEAIEMAKKYRADGYEDAYIAVIDDEGDPICVDEIRDF
nr:MAG TPA: hypothetical protein [Caudoviricetes sp.]